jgi:hypothetical protein
VFENSEISYTDYFRNYFQTEIDYDYGSYDFILQYENEINEYLGNANYDFFQNRVSAGYRNFCNAVVSHSVFLEYENRDYEILYNNDTTLVNMYNQISFLVDLRYKVFDPLSIQLENHFIKKIYQQQSEIESDYIWNYLKPAINTDLSSTLQLELGYEWEKKLYGKNVNTDFSFKEQDYESNGLFSSLNYFNNDLMSISMTFSYQWRRYPKTPANDLISLYSSRDIMSLIALVNLPLTQNSSFNILIVYDNDKDIDSDQDNAQSSIYNIELQYKL